MLKLHEICNSVQITIHCENLFSDIHLEILPSYFKTPDNANYFYPECGGSWQVEILRDIWVRLIEAGGCIETEGRNLRGH